MQLTRADDLANWVRMAAENSTILTAKMGRDMRVRRWWMDIDYPYRPPPEFERSGYDALVQHEAAGADCLPGSRSTTKVSSG
jgi:hypothetical protein